MKGVFQPVVRNDLDIWVAQSFFDYIYISMSAVFEVGNRVNEEGHFGSRTIRMLPFPVLLGADQVRNVVGHLFGEGPSVVLDPALETFMTARGAEFSGDGDCEILETVLHVGRYCDKGYEGTLGRYR